MDKLSRRIAMGILLCCVLFCSACRQNVRRSELADTKKDEAKWQALNGQIDAQGAEIRALQQKLGLLELELSALTERSERTDGAKESERPERKVDASKPVPAPIPLIQSEVLAPPSSMEKVTDSRHGNVQYYLEGHQFFKAKKHDKADISLRRFLALEPDHVYADRAQFLLILNNFSNREFGVAVLEGSRFESTYPYSHKVPEVLRLLAESHRKLGQTAAAQKIANRLKREYPGTKFSTTF